MLNCLIATTRLCKLITGRGCSVTSWHGGDNTRGPYRQQEHAANPAVKYESNRPIIYVTECGPSRPDRSPQRCHYSSVRCSCLVNVFLLFNCSMWGRNCGTNTQRYVRSLLIVQFAHVQMLGA